MSKTTGFVLMAVFAASAAVSLLAQPGEGKVLFYQDPMHPWYQSDKPGVAPDCGMKLVPVYALRRRTSRSPGNARFSITRMP